MNTIYKHLNGTLWNVKERTDERTLLNRVDSLNIVLNVNNNQLKEFKIV